MGPTGTTRVLQVHPTRRCNLRCLHCYSSSSPEERGALDATLLFNAVGDATDEGYNWISVSGGEPLMYAPLPRLLRHARNSGMSTALVTNGMLLDARRLDALQPVTDLVVISIDGVPESHNRMRGSERAFDLTTSRMGALRERGMPFGIIFTLTQHNLDELPWVVNFAQEQGAQLVQVHPLEDVGAAAMKLRGSRPDETECAYGWLLSRQLELRSGGQLAIQVDLTLSTALCERPELFYATGYEPDASRRFSALLSPLVIEPDGIVSPLQYGFARPYALGNIRTARLRNMMQDWRGAGMLALHAVCRQVYEEARCASAPYFFNWYERVAQLAETAGLHARASAAG